MISVSGVSMRFGSKMQACPTCGTALVHVSTDVSSGAFRTQAASMPQMPIHYYDCPSCNTCWKLGQRLLPDPIRQILRG